jgi:hypothetical protein
MIEVGNSLVSQTQKSNNFDIGVGHSLICGNKQSGIGLFYSSDGHQYSTTAGHL